MDVSLRFIGLGFVVAFLSISSLAAAANDDVTRASPNVSASCNNPYKLVLHFPPIHFPPPYNFIFLLCMPLRLILR